MQKKKKQLDKIFRRMHKNETKGEISVQFMDYEKLHRYLGWKPKYILINTLPKLFRWYKKYFKNKK